MKELYTAPEAKLTGFVSAEELASIKFDDLLASMSGGTPGTPAGKISGDIDLPFKPDSLT